MILGQKQTWRPVELDRGPRYESIQVCSANFCKGAKNIQWWKTASSTDVAGETGFLRAENWK
jgi:hypothetical protein